MELDPANLSTRETVFLTGTNEIIAECGGKEASNGFRENYFRLLGLLNDSQLPQEAREELRKTITNLQKAEKIALMGSELGEALEGLRGKNESDKLLGYTAEEEELADVAIRMFSYANMFGLRLAEAIVLKMRYNATRPYKHGKKF